MQQADPNLWNTVNYSNKLRIAYDHPPTLFFSACRNVKAQAGSDPLHAWLRPRSSMLSLRSIFFLQRYRPARCSSMDFYFSALCRCQGSSRLRPFYLTIMVQTGSQSQQNSSQLSFSKRFFLFIFHIWSRMLQRARSRLKTTNKEPNGFDRTSIHFRFSRYDVILLD